MPTEGFIAANGEPEDSLQLRNGNTIYRFAREQSYRYGPKTIGLPIRTVKEGTVTVDGPNGPETREVLFETTTYETVPVGQDVRTDRWSAVLDANPHGIIVRWSYWGLEEDWARFSRL